MAIIQISPVQDMPSVEAQTTLLHTLWVTEDGSVAQAINTTNSIATQVLVGGTIVLASVPEFANLSVSQRLAYELFVVLTRNTKTNTPLVLDNLPYGQIIEVVRHLCNIYPQNDPRRTSILRQLRRMVLQISKDFITRSQWTQVIGLAFSEGTTQVD